MEGGDLVRNSFNLDIASDAYVAWAYLKIIRIKLEDSVMKVV